MSAARLSLVALAFLAACDGNPFVTPVAPVTSLQPSIATLPSTSGTASAATSIERHEATVTGESDADRGSGFAFKNGQILYDAASDTFSVDNLAFDGGNVYTRDAAITARLPASVKAFRGASTYADSLTGVQIDQFSYRALYGVSRTGRGQFAIVRTGAYVPYGFGGFIYSRTGGVTLPTSGQANYSGTYTALRDANGFPLDGRKLAYVVGDMEMSIDFNDFNPDEGTTGNGSGIKGYVFNRKVYTLGGTDITGQVVSTIEEDNNLTPGQMGDLPTLVFTIGPGVLDNNGEAEGELTSTIPTSEGGVQGFEEGKYYAVLSGTNAEEVAGVIVVTSKVGDATLRETGGFLLYRP